MSIAKQKRKDEARKDLTTIASVLHTSNVARASDVLKRIRAALATDAARMRELSEQMDKLAESHNRYLALQREARAHEQSAYALKALLGHEAYYAVMKEDETAAIGEQIEFTPTTRELRAQAPLWQHVAQYLRFVPEAQVGEILEFLKGLGIKTSRQAIESAVQTHSKMFTVKKRGREKFVSLK